MWSEFASAKDALAKSASSQSSSDTDQGDLSEMAAAMTAWNMEQIHIHVHKYNTKMQINLQINISPESYLNQPKTYNGLQTAKYSTKYQHLPNPDINW